MPIAKTENIYSELTTETLTKIKQICSNIDEYSDNVPEELKNGTKFYITDLKGLTTTYKLYGTTVDGLTKVVPYSTVVSQFNNFLSSRNLTTKTGKSELQSLRSIMYWYNNISAFLAVRLKVTKDSFNHGPFVFYDSTDQSYREIPYVTETVINPDFPVNQVKDAITYLINDAMNTENIHLVYTSLKYNI